MDTIVACLTPPGKAAIATVAVRGPNAWSITRSLLQPTQGALPAAPPVGRCFFGRFGVDSRDEVIVAAKEDSVEVHCHGGVEVVRWIQELFVERGATVAPWQQFFAAGPLIELLAHAPTLRTATILLDQVNGAWSSVKQERAERLARLIPLGRHLVEPWQVVLAGAPNVGKSSLMNALAGYTRSIVASTPGTTRDVVRTRIAIDGWPIELIDTAGIRESGSDLERQGIERAQAAVANADLRFWLLDGSAAPTYPADRTGWEFLVNKCDLPPAWDCRGTCRISAQSLDGLAELCEMISQTLVPVVPEPGEAVPCLPEHLKWVREQRVE